MITVYINKKQIGERIKAIRKNAGWTLEQFGLLVNNASRGTVSNWENGSNVPNEKRLEIIAVLGHTSVDWIMYGDIKDFVSEIFKKLQMPELLEEDFFNEVINKLNTRKFSYNINEVINAAIEVRPALLANQHFYRVTKQVGLTFEEIRYYDFEEERRYREVYLPLLSSLFKKDEVIENENEKFNNQIILRTLDMLDRMDYELKEKLNEIIKRISWISTRNILEAGIPYLPEYASYGGYTKTVPFSEKEKRTEENITKDYKLLKAEILVELDRIFVENFNKKK